MKNIKGFTILELVVSIAIFSTVVVTVLGLVNSSNRAKNKSYYSVIAANLASEAIEVITSVRDNNFLNNRSYYNGIYNYNDNNFILIFNNTNNTWSFDRGSDNNSETITSCANSNNNSCAVYKHKTLNYYTQARNNYNSNLEKTKFYRLIRVQSYNDYIRITSSVLWIDGGVNNTVTLVKDLYNWD